MSDATSVEHGEWREIAQVVRLKLQARIPEMDAMNPEELHCFVQALNKAESFEFACECRDERLERYRQKLALMVD